ncbi:hypothetical protein EDC94DRAFT_527109 [Helicostylum pulchrum]|nr:hypothetical protein EDC94DRAFT_527109 [Helicostylum pulchrum]
MSDTIAFEHFDPELELGNLDANGRPIRPRKKPGRKPNPPSPAQRKAQNRAAQRAFRERKRREMRDAESLVKKCIYARDCALRENTRLSRRLEELKFETNYLKGYALTLKMACIANQVEVPKFWDTGVTDDTGADEMTFSKTKGVPQQLEFFLDKQMNIITSHLETPFFQQLLNTDLVGSNPLNNPTFCPTNNAKNIGLYSTAVHSCPPPSSLEEQQEQEEDDSPILDAKTGLPRKTTQFNLEQYNNSAASSSDDNSSTSSSSAKNVFPPMTPLDAINRMRSVKNLDVGTRALFIPTELQRSIPHDTRIDVVPGAALRDHMILFQDFYDANELFGYLAESSVFLGGKLGNPDSWFVPPNFFKRYWFLCPNHKHDRMDNALEIMVGLGKKMIQLMTQRKQMYIERDLYSEYFPEPTVEQVVQHVVDQVFLERDDQQHLDDIYNTPMEDMFSMEDDDESCNQAMDLLASDLPLGSVFI